MKTKHNMEHLIEVAKSLHKDEGGVAMTEYIIVFSLIALGATVSLIGVAYYVKGYRDFMMWWMTHPAV